MGVPGEVQELVPFTLTLVHYTKGDALGLILALATLAPIFAVVSYVTALVVVETGASRARIGVIFVGQMINVGLNVALKHVIKQPRPISGPHLEHFGQFGMPSNHSQFMWFAAGFAFASWLKGLQYRSSAALTRLLTLTSLCLACVVTWSRVYLGYHSVEQVYVGACVGLLAGTAWCTMVYTNIFPVSQPAHRKGA
mmetsp:Transcript_20209/g.35923  ORF Transcript_20209/g.35923 Transcript_20209/m.35923 type:complete len:196 (-) Transcript_20209:343-930(-)